MKASIICKVFCIVSLMGLSAIADPYQPVGPAGPSGPLAEALDPNTELNTPCTPNAAYTGEVTIKKVTGVTTYMLGTIDMVEVVGWGGVVGGMNKSESVKMIATFRKVKDCATAGCTTQVARREAFGVACENTARNAFATASSLTLREVSLNNSVLSVTSTSTPGTPVTCRFEVKGTNPVEVLPPAYCSVKK